MQMDDNKLTNNLSFVRRLHIGSWEIRELAPHRSTNVHVS